MARPSFSLASFLLRWLVALVLVFATFNPTDYSYYRWVAGMGGGNLALKALAGVALVIMECLNDLGAVQYLGVDTLSASIYATWLQRSNLGGAAQLSAIMLVFVAALFAYQVAKHGAESTNIVAKCLILVFERNVLTT